MLGQTANQRIAQTIQILLAQVNHSQNLDAKEFPKTLQISRFLQLVATGVLKDKQSTITCIVSKERSRTEETTFSQSRDICSPRCGSPGKIAPIGWNRICGDASARKFLLILRLRCPRDADLARALSFLVVLRQSAGHEMSDIRYAYSAMPWARTP